MTDERSEEQGPSVFGNLPASRPGTRSPRRASGARPRPGPPPSASAAPDTPPATGEPRGTREGEEASSERDEPDAGRAGIEDLAWAGVAVAAEAATLGVRLATRAVEALRDAAPPR